MKFNRPLIISLCLMVLISALYRIMPNRPWGFAPQIAMGLFSGALFVKDKKWAFALPILSLFLSDLLYQVLHSYGLTPISGFYSGQWVNYLIFAGISCFGFLIKMDRIGNVAIAALAAPTTFFLLSNLQVWLSPIMGLGREKNFSGLILTYYDALPFFKYSVMATVIFSAILFGTYYLAQNRFTRKELA